MEPVNTELAIGDAPLFIPGTKYVLNAVSNVPFWNCVLCKCFSPFGTHDPEACYNKWGQFGTCLFNAMKKKGEKFKTECGVESRLANAA